MEEVVKDKKPSPALYYVRIIGTLFVITAVVAVLLALVNMVTKPTIERLAEEKKAAAMAQVIPGADSYEPQVNWAETVDPILDIQAAKKNGAVLGYCVQVQTNGFGGALELMVGVSHDGAVTGVSILSHSETLNTDKHGELLAQYPGSRGEVAISKDGGEINAISGATVTSRAVTRGVNSALGAVAPLIYAQGGAQ